MGPHISCGTTIRSRWGQRVVYYIYAYTHLCWVRPHIYDSRFLADWVYKKDRREKERERERRQLALMLCRRCGGTDIIIDLGDPLCPLHIPLYYSYNTLRVYLYCSSYTYEPNGNMWPSDFCVFRSVSLSKGPLSDDKSIPTYMHVPEYSII